MNEIPREELESVLRELTYAGRSFDVAMFFIMEDIDYDDIFVADYIANKNFYIEVFQHIWSWTLGQLERFNDINKVCSHVVLKLRCEPYENDKIVYKETGCVKRDWFSKEYIKQLLGYLVVRYEPDAVNTVIDHLVVNDGIDIRVLKPILTSDTQLCQNSIIENIIRGEYMPVEDVLDLLIERGKIVDEDTIRDLILKVFFNPILLLKLTYSVMEYYDIVHKLTDTEVIVDVKFKRNVPSATRDVLDTIRRMLHSIIYIEAEYDFYNFLEDARLTYLALNENRRSNAYFAYQKWMVSDTRISTQIPNLVALEYEDNGILSENDYDLLRSDSLLVNYVSDLDTLDGFELFKRMFNINRLYVCQYRRQNYICDKASVSACHSENYDILTMATDLNLYLFLTSGMI